MRAIWRSVPPVTTREIMEKLEGGKKWKPQTVLTLLVRLIEKGFLASEKTGRDRSYTPRIAEDDYLQVETGDFMKRYYGNSVGSLVKTMYEGKNLSKKDLEELRAWLDERM
jgi:predicted transcriptional regulator